MGRHTCEWGQNPGLALGRTWNSSPGLCAVWPSALCHMLLRKSPWSPCLPPVGGMATSSTRGHGIVQEEAQHRAEGPGCLWPWMGSCPGGFWPQPNVQESCFLASNSQKALLAEKLIPKELHCSRLLALLTMKREPRVVQLSSPKQCDQIPSKSEQLI